jgi:hypothetical protein
MPMPAPAAVADLVCQDLGLTGPAASAATTHMTALIARIQQMIATAEVKSTITGNATTLVLGLPIVGPVLGTAIGTIT